jgi:hypothetical protein
MDHIIMLLVVGARTFRPPDLSRQMMKNTPYAGRR